MISICSMKWEKIMVQKYRLLFIILMITIMVTAVHAQAQTMQSSPAGSASNAIASSENNVVEILALDSVAFPKIKVNLFIDKFCAMTGNLKIEDFKVEEDGNEAAIDNFYFTGSWQMKPVVCGLI